MQIHGREPVSVLRSSIPDCTLTLILEIGSGDFRIFSDAVLTLMMTPGTELMWRGFLQGTEVPVNGIIGVLRPAAT